MEQKTMKVKCPTQNCGAIITIPDMPGIADKMLTCPICKYRDKVAEFIAEMNKDAEDPTQICFRNEDDTIGALRIDGTSYPLNEGKNTIGRKSVSSVADIQLVVDDRYMSRMHICISVVKNNNGYQHRIENITTNNHVFVNGKEMQSNEVLVLKHGDIIRLGHTDIQFVRK